MRNEKSSNFHIVLLDMILHIWSELTSGKWCTGWLRNKDTQRMLLLCSRTIHLSASGDWWLFYQKDIFTFCKTFLRKIDWWEKNVQIWSFTWDHILELHTSALPQFLLPIDRYLCFRFLLHRFFPDFASPMGRQLSRLINNDTIRKKKDWGKSYILKLKNQEYIVAIQIFTDFISTRRRRSYHLR